MTGSAGQALDVLDMLLGEKSGRESEGGECSGSVLHRRAGGFCEIGFYLGKTADS